MIFYYFYIFWFNDIKNKLKKYYFNIFLNKKYFKNNYLTLLMFSFNFKTNYKIKEVTRLGAILNCILNNVSLKLNFFCLKLFFYVFGLI